MAVWASCRSFIALSYWAPVDVLSTLSLSCPTNFPSCPILGITSSWMANTRSIWEGPSADLSPSLQEIPKIKKETSSVERIVFIVLIFFSKIEQCFLEIKRALHFEVPQSIAMARFLIEIRGFHALVHLDVLDHKFKSLWAYGLDEAERELDSRYFPVVLVIHDDRELLALDLLLDVLLDLQATFGIVIDGPVVPDLQFVGLAAAHGLHADQADIVGRELVQFGKGGGLHPDLDDFLWSEFHALALDDLVALVPVEH